MVHMDLSANEARVIGCLMEKSIVTPDLCPLTLNALTNACNQKSSRDPIMALSPREVRGTTQALEEKRLLRVDLNPKNGVEKYGQRFCNTTFSQLQLTPSQFAIVCLLLLRGPHTPGELRVRSNRLHFFADNREVSESLESLIQHEQGPLVVELPRTAKRKDSEYMHLFCGPIDIDVHVKEASKKVAEGESKSTRLSHLEQRVSVLEEQLAELLKGTSKNINGIDN